MAYREILVRSCNLQSFPADTVQTGCYNAMQAGKAALTHAFVSLPAGSIPPSAVIMNMGIWCDSTRSPQEQQAHQTFSTILQHGQELRRSQGLATRLIWKTTTATLKTSGGFERNWGKASGPTDLSHSGLFCNPSCLECNAMLTCIPTCFQHHNLPRIFIPFQNILLRL